MFKGIRIDPVRHATHSLANELCHCGMRYPTGNGIICRGGERPKLGGYAAIASKAAESFIDSAILHNPDYYPLAAVPGKAHKQTTVSQDFQRKMTRSWTELKASVSQ
jgi:hypothetical protein